MPCINNDPCQEPCTDCSPSNPGYDNCGCLNPTTFECITLPGVLPSINVTNTMNGKQVLQAINDKINDLTVATPNVGVDIFAKVSNTDTTASYLSNKLLGSPYISLSVVNAGANEKIRWSLSPSTLISNNTGNLLQLGTDGKLRVLPNSTPVDISVVQGTGITVTGSGPASDPFVISSTSAVNRIRPCFDDTWRDLSILATGNNNVIKTAGIPKYKIKYDGTIEFRGSLTYTVAFGVYTTGTSRFTIPVSNVPVLCLTASEQTYTSDLKSINYILPPASPTNTDIQMYGYIIRKINQNLFIEFQSSLSTASTKTIVVNFEGCLSYPSI